MSRSVKRGSVSFGSKGPKAPPNIFGEGIAAPVPTELTRRPSVRIILPEEHEDKEEEAGSMSDIPAVDFDGAVMNEKRSSKVCTHAPSLPHVLQLAHVRCLVLFPCRCFPWRTLAWRE